MTIAQALQTIHDQCWQLGRAAASHNEAAIQVIAANAQYREYRHPITEELLVCAVESWQAYQAENPQADV